MSKIVKVIGREIIDSVVTRLLKPKYTEGGFVGMAAAPSGASTGSREAGTARWRQIRFWVKA